VSHEPLAGFTVGVTAARRREELSSLLERRGARVVYAPAIRLVPLADDTELLDATRALIAEPVDDVIVTTGVGFRAWLETAEGWGLREDLIKLLGEARVLAHGPRAMGAVRAAGVRETWSPSSDGREDLLRHLLEQDLTGRRIAVQVDGEPASPLTGSLRRAGAHVIEIPVYRWARTDDPTPLRRLVGQAVAGTVDAITFTSEPAVTATLAVAAEDDLEELLLEAMRTHVVAACVGPVTAAPLRARGVAPTSPRRARSPPRAGRPPRTTAPERPAAHPGGRATHSGHPGRAGRPAGRRQEQWLIRR
jgi:uroporphyrinogen-III synthase